MADNVAITAGSGTTIATDDVGGAHYQKMKLYDGTADSSAEIPGDVTNGLDVDVTRVQGSVAVTHAALTELATAIDTEMQCDIVGALPAGDNNIGNIDIASIAAGDNNIGNVDIVSSALPTGASTLAEQQTQTTALQLIDDVVATLGTTTYSEATTKGNIIAAVRRDADTTLVDTTNELGPLQMDANGRLKVEVFSGEALPVTLTSTTVTSISAGDNNIGNVDVVTLPALAAGTNNIGDVDVLTLPALPAGNNNIGDVDIASGTLTTVTTVSTVTAVTTITNPVTVAGGAAHASPVSGNPNLIAGRASNAIPTDVGADGDVASLWTNRHGALAVLNAPHIGLNGDPWSLVHEGVQYTAAQTSAIVIDAAAGEKIVVTQVQIQCFSTTAGTAILYFGTGAFARGTNRAIFDGDFSPSATLKPGVILQGPFIAGANGDDLRFTSVGDLDITLSIWYYVVT